MKRNVRVYIEDILESIDIIEEYMKSVSEDEFYQNTLLQDAVIRRLEIIGEAAKHIPNEIRNVYPNIPWKQMAGLRDVLIHAYFQVTLRRVWKVVTGDLDNLKNGLRQVLMDLFQ
jgi:uncharacterized protein with HEPN domain